MAVVNLTSEVYPYMGKSEATITTEETALVNLLLPMAQAAVEEFLGYGIESTTYTEYLPSTPVRIETSEFADALGSFALSGGEVLQLSNLPVRAITSVQESETAGLAGGDWPDPLPSANYGVDWSQEGLSWSGQLIRQGGSWTNTLRGVKVVYQAGLSAEELGGKYSLFKLAVLQTISKFYVEAKSHQENAGVGSGGVGAILSETLGEYHVYYDSASARELTGFTYVLPFSVQRMLEPYRRLTRFI